jgi:hypothetical protein
MLTRNERTRRQMKFRLLSMLPATVALASLIATGTALADGPLDAVSTVQQPVVSVTEPVTEAVQTVTAPAEPVVEAAQPVTQTAQPVTQAVNQVTAAATPVTSTTQSASQAAAPVTQAVTLAATAVTTPVTQAVTQATTAVTKPVTAAVSQVQQAASSTAVAKSVTRTTAPTTPAGGSAALSSPVVVGGAFSSAPGVATGRDGSRATSGDVRATAVVGGQGHAVDLGNASLAPDQLASWAFPAASGSLPQAGAASRVLVAGGSSRGSAPGGAIGLAALLGLLGLAAFRSGQVASGLAAVSGTGALRAASQSLLTFVWSGRCMPLGGADGSANAARADGAIRSSMPAALGGRGGAKGVLDRPDVARGGGSLPPGLALIEQPRGGGGPSAVLWGLLVGASAALGALLGRVTGGGRPAADEAS